jgi:hypothetical protein
MRSMLTVRVTYVTPCLVTQVRMETRLDSLRYRELPGGGAFDVLGC